MTTENQDWKHLKLRRDGVCCTCGVPLRAGTPALWSASRKIVSCVSHLKTVTSPQENVESKEGAEGEVAIGKLLDSLAVKYDFQVLHDRLIPKSRANIDHIAVTKHGIFVIDAKHYQGIVRIKDNSGFFEKSAPELWVGKRNCMKLVTGVKKQTSVVKDILSSSAIEMQQFVS